MVFLVMGQSYELITPNKIKSWFSWKNLCFICRFFEFSKKLENHNCIPKSVITTVLKFFFVKKINFESWWGKWYIYTWVDNRRPSIPYARNRPDTHKRFLGFRVWTNQLMFGVVWSLYVGPNGDWGQLTDSQGYCRRMWHLHRRWNSHRRQNLSGHDNWTTIRCHPFHWCKKLKP